MESLHYLLMKAHTVLNKKVLSSASEIGLTAGQPKVLEFLVKHEGSDQKTIAAYCEIEPATVGSILMRMEKAGMIERKQHPGNRRSLFVYLTEKGRRAAGEMSRLFADAEESAVWNMSGREIADLKQILTKLCRNLSEEAIEKEKVL